MTTIKEINHDSSTTLSDFYDSITDPDGGLTVTAGAALNSSTFGVNADYDAGNNLMLVRETLPSYASDTELNMRFRVDFSNLSHSGVAASIMSVVLDDTPSSNDPFSVDFRYNGADAILVTASYYSDSGGKTAIVAEFSVSVSSELCFEVKAVKETADGNADGTAEFFLNGASQGSISNADNFNNFNIADRVHVGFASISGTISGSLDYDEWILDDDSTSLLCIDAITVSHIWLSTDGGATYSNIGDSAWAANLVGGVVVVPGTAYGTIFAAVGTNLYKTVNGGTAWTLETAVGYEVDFIDLEKDNTTVFLAKRDAAGTNRASLWDSVGASLTHINTGKSTTGGATSGGDVV